MRRSFLLAAAGTLIAGRAMAQSFTDAQRAEIVEILRDVLVAPEAPAAVLEAMRADWGSAADGVLRVDGGMIRG